MFYQEEYQDLLAQIETIENIGLDCRAQEPAKQLYHEAKDARIEARQIERNYYLNTGEDTSRNYWEIVAKHALTLLLDYSRDIEVMSWLIESLCRLDGYEGLTFAFEAMQTIVAKFGTDMYPLLDEDDPDEWKCASLAGLNGEDKPGSLIIPLNQIEIIEVPAICVWQLQQSQQTSENNSDSEQLLTHTDIISAIQNKGLEYALNIVEHIEACLNAFKAMNDALWNKFSDMCPSLNRIEQSIQQALQIVKSFSVEIFGEHIFSTESIEQAIENDEINANIQVASGSEMNRARAIIQMEEIAHFFQTAEPHSPLPYMLRRIISWSKLSWPELMQVMIKNSDEINHIVQQTGMPVLSEE